jgi:hypothetical protein
MSAAGVEVVSQASFPSLRIFVKKKIKIEERSRCIKYQYRRILDTVCGAICQPIYVDRDPQVYDEM